MTGTLINVATVLVGSIIGIAFNKKLPDRFVKIVFQGLGLFTLFLGFTMASKVGEILILVFSIVLGGITGELLHLEKRMDQSADWLKTKLKFKNDKFSEGAVTAFLLFCMGSLTILGAIEEGMNNKTELLVTKAVMDGFAAIALASAFGSGVAFSVIPLLIYQGGLTLFAGVLGNYIDTAIINELTAVGGLILLGLGINMLEIKKLKVLNLLPALVYAVVFAIVFAK